LYSLLSESEPNNPVFQTQTKDINISILGFRVDKFSQNPLIKSHNTAAILSKFSIVMRSNIVTTEMYEHV
jgi:hypothetical protein